MRSPRVATFVALCVSFALVAVMAAPGGAQEPPPPDNRFDHAFSTPVLGLDAVPGRNQVLVADAEAGIVRVWRSRSALITPLPGVSDVLAINGNRMFAITGSPPEEENVGGNDLQGPPPSPASLFFVWGRGQNLRAVGDIGAAEAALDPDGRGVDSNPFGLVRLGRHIIVADAGANTIWAVHIRTGKVTVVATLPQQMADTQWLKDAVGCPEPADPESAELCGLPPEMPTDPVPTSVAIGPDGFIYVGELTGFPGGPGLSRVWRIDPTTRNADCATSDLCEVVVTGLTSVVDIDFASNGLLAVAELDRATFLAAEQGEGIGGAVSTCDVTSGQCTDIDDGLQLLTGIAVGRNDKVFASVLALIPNLADVVVVGNA